MIDIKLMREDLKRVIDNLSRRGADFSYLKDIAQLDDLYRADLSRVESLKSEKNVINKEVGFRKKDEKDCSDLFAKIEQLNNQIDQLEIDVALKQETILAALLDTPNLIDESVKVGKDSSENKVIKYYKEKTVFSFTPAPHYEIATNLDILDFERGANVTGSRFVFYKGLGARLERAIKNFMLDLHEKKGYLEMTPPFIVNKDSLRGSGQLPKFEEDLFKLEMGFYLIPTAEVPLVNYHQNEILSLDQLPLYYTAYSPCFRLEAGAAGKDTRGIIRNHQFTKVELVKLTCQEESMNELEKLTRDAEEVLELLGLPYRRVELCSGDTGFASSKTYDLEVYFPSSDDYKEISSCSNCSDFQARRANIRYRVEKNSRPLLVHTLNGSGLAVGRTLAAILENYQLEDGSVKIPDVLIKYMGTDIIRRK